MVKTRNTLVDPQPGDRFSCENDIITVETRETRVPSQHIRGAGNARDYIRYRLGSHPGLLCIAATTGIKRRGWKPIA